MNDNKRHLQSFFIFALFALLFALIVCMMRPFFTVILWTALFLSVLLMFASFIPLMGAALVWLPVGVAICASGAFVKGIIILVLSAVCISFLDNFLRPLFLKDRNQVHPLVIFFSILGGISFFGMNGLILGPLIVILFFTVLDLLVSSKKAANAEAKSPEKAEK